MFNDYLDKVDQAFKLAKGNAKQLRYNLLQMQGLMLALGIRPPKVITELLDDLNLRMNVLDHELDYIFHLLYEEG